jgi:hypothetical protein
MKTLLLALLLTGCATAQSRPNDNDTITEMQLECYNDSKQTFSGYFEWVELYNVDMSANSVYIKYLDPYSNTSHEFRRTTSPDENCTVAVIFTFERKDIKEMLE